MSINRYRKHLLILSEDDAYKDIANGFVNHYAIVGTQIHIAQSAGGWRELLTLFTQTYLGDVRKYQERHVLMLLDLDGDQKNRTSEILEAIPNDVKDRVFFLCCLDEAEDFKRELGYGKFENFGERLAESCYCSTYGGLDPIWGCMQLNHNNDELIRLAMAVRPLLF